MDKTEYRVVGVRRFPEFPALPISWQGSAGTDLSEIERLAEAARKRGNEEVRVQKCASLLGPWIDVRPEDPQ